MLNKAKLPIVNRIKEKGRIVKNVNYNLIENKYRTLDLKNILSGGLHLDKLLNNTYSYFGTVFSSYNPLISHTNTHGSDKLRDNEKKIQGTDTDVARRWRGTAEYWKDKKKIYSLRLNQLYYLVFNSIKYKNLGGIRMEVKGRLTPRYRADRSVYKLRWKGGLRDIASSYNGLPVQKNRGHLNPNVSYSIFSSKRRVGAFAVKGWTGAKYYSTWNCKSFLIPPLTAFLKNFIHKHIWNFVYRWVHYLFCFFFPLPPSMLIDFGWKLLGKQQVIFEIENLFNTLYIKVVESHTRLLMVTYLAYYVNCGFLLEGELLVLDPALNTLLSIFLVSFVAIKYCIYIACWFIAKANYYNFNIKYPYIYNSLIIFFVILLFVCYFYNISVSKKLIYYIVEKIINKVLGRYYWGFFGDSPSSSGGNPSSGSGQPSGSTGGNPRGPQGNPGGPQGNGPDPSNFAGYGHSDNNRRRRSNTPCETADCYYPEYAENENRFNKKCHESFYNKCKIRINEVNNQGNPTAESEIRPRANISINTGLAYADFTKHEQNSAMRHINSTLNNNDFLVAKPEGRPEAINGIPLTAEAKVESAGSILYMSSRGMYQSVTNKRLQGVLNDARFGWRTL